MSSFLRFEAFHHFKHASNSENQKIEKNERIFYGKMRLFFTTR